MLHWNEIKCMSSCVHIFSTHKNFNMHPKSSYRIWFSNRNGSTLLCKGLEETGIAGIPGEYFTDFGHASLCDKFGVGSYEALKTKLWEIGTSPNGVFGIKHSTIKGNVEEIKQLRVLDTQNAEEILNDLFPNCKHIFLTRRNKIRQAVSWWKAIKDETWHLEKGQEHSNPPDFYEKNYDFDAVHHLFREASLRECAIQAYFSEYNIIPLTLVYEDFIKDFNGTLKRIIDYLEIEYDTISYPSFFYSKTANERSEEWVQRFRKELQEKMGIQTW